MRSFFKSFFASLLAIIVFSLIALFIVIRMVKSATEDSVVSVPSNAVLVIDLSTSFSEREKDNTIAAITTGVDADVPSLYELLSLIRYAKNDGSIAGIYLKAADNPNGFATSEEIRAALIDFKTSRKFVVAFANTMQQKAYYIANAADKVYVNPVGDFQWQGLSVNYVFLKGTLDKLEVQPQIFYAGKFKSATEPLRAYSMSEANKLQTTVWLNDLNDKFLSNTADSRGVEISILKELAAKMAIETPEAAVTYNLIDGVKYDDEIKDIFKEKLKLDKYDKIPFITLNEYASARNVFSQSGSKIALIVAEGDIVDGLGTDEQIGGESYRNLIRKARLDQSIKAIVVRINSGGGSALASEIILRELQLAKEDKPVIISFGDVAASGGYYMATAADSIFALPNTITGSIGVFGIIPDLSKFFKNKLGVTFDGVKTAPYADAPTTNRPLQEEEKKAIQRSIDRVYATFLNRVANGRGLDSSFVDSIAQGRVWTGSRALEIGLVDKIGYLNDAITAAANKANLANYKVEIYPKAVGFFEKLFNSSKEPVVKANLIRNELGEEHYKLFQYIKSVKESFGTIQAKLPFEFYVK